MGWGTNEHEGIADGKRADGTWTDGTWRGSHGDYDRPVAVQATCSCGWRSEQLHAIGLCSTDSAAREPWWARSGQAEERCYDDWRAEHYDPLLGYEPHSQLILARDSGGERHFLNGRPVHAGSALELKLQETWVKVIYESSWSSGLTATASLLLGGPAEAERQGDTPLVSFALPPRAVLRWPQNGQR